ncbi:hypothetical protein SOVF_138170 [Spinacia oleracea]|uniref:Uncharacterized protein isoform X5 n=1 Tax=Spinacia oleracea TaxID=3562 RepID=A0A9R0JKL0_SPIOL|nr:uncharacterized protein LOC110777457 isoform X5 [Spinacia oleracea]KNA11116.1 hypothetical protein SOVF_138170 [Spinacia oleracea]
MDSSGAGKFPEKNRTNFPWEMINSSSSSSSDDEVSSDVLPERSSDCRSTLTFATAFPGVVAESSVSIQTPQRNWVQLLKSEEVLSERSSVSIDNLKANWNHTTEPSVAESSVSVQNPLRSSSVVMSARSSGSRSTSTSIVNNPKATPYFPVAESSGVSQMSIENTQRSGYSPGHDSWDEITQGFSTMENEYAFIEDAPTAIPTRSPPLPPVTPQLSPLCFATVSPPQFPMSSAPVSPESNVGCVADPFAQADTSIEEVLAAAEELMMHLKVSGSENDFVAAGITERLMLTTRRAKKLLHFGGCSDSLAVRKDLMFHKVLIPSDVGKMKCFVIPKVFADKYFPKISSIKNHQLLGFKDLTGKLWTFLYTYSYDYQSYILAEGWSRFVEEKQLAAGDAVYFYHGVGGEDKYKFFIHWNRRDDAAANKDLTTIADDFTANALPYCALFPHSYEFDKDTIIQLWMAHGVFVNEPMEKIAGLIFEKCVIGGYLLFCQTNLVTGKAMYKSGRVGSLISSVSDKIVHIEGNSNLNDVSVEVSHMSIRCYRQENSCNLQELRRFKQLRTLMFLHGRESSFKQVPRDMFLSMKLLHVLDLSQTHLMELPSSIGNMKCLRYLNLSETLITRLPEAVDCLENLQTLKLRGCSNLSSLPKGMRKLVNLRHLDLDVRRQLRLMPPWLGNLFNIQTLSAFLVGLGEECNIRQLKNMNNLSGNFCISRLENVLTEDEAAEAHLCYKPQLKKLELQWSDTQDDVLGNREVVSSLKPNTNLEELHISCYGGFELPRWICDPAFTKLVSVTLFKCENCSVLPSLGLLLSLRFLNILDFYKLEVIDHNFSGGVGIQGFNAFPKLKKLAIENMLSLEEWTGMGKSDFPCLVTLTIKNCPKLSSLCTLSYLHSLKNLEISHCDTLESWTDGRLPASVETLIIEDCPMICVESLQNGGPDWHKVAHVQNVWVDNQEISFGGSSLIENPFTDYFVP